MEIKCIFCNEPAIGPGGGSNWKKYACNPCKTRAIDFNIDLLLNVKKSISNPWIHVKNVDVRINNDEN